MQNENYLVRHEITKYKSIFYVERLNALYENELYKELKTLAYGDGNFYLQKYGSSITKIIFETTDECYVEEDFCKAHAKEIANALTKLSKKCGADNSLKLFYSNTMSN